MVRETRHLWVGNLPDNIREDRIREHFKRYGRVQNVKLLGRTETASAGACAVAAAGASATGGAVSGVCATVAFMDIKSASKAHNAEHVLDERTLTTEYYEPAAIPSAAGAPSAGSSPAGSGYSGSSSSVNSASAPAPAPAPASVARYHLSVGEEGTTGTCAIAATAAAPANWRGTNDSATEYCRRGNTPATFGRYQRNNSNAPYATTPPSNVERTTPHHRWYTSGERGATGTESAPSTPGGGTDSGRRRRSGSGSSRSDTSSPEPSDASRASTPAGGGAPTACGVGVGAARTPPNHHHQWASTASGRPLAICVRNLPTRSTDSSLKDGLYHEYKKHGKVVWVKVVGQNADRYAVVRFKKPSDVEKALEVSQDKHFFGCKISVAPHQSCDEDADSAKPYETDIDEYHPKATRTLFIGNLEKDVTQQQLRDKFKHFGRIIEIDIKKGSGGGAGYAFCQYASISSVVEAIRAMDGEYVGGSRVKLGFGKPVATTCVWVDGLTEHTEKQVLGCVSRCGAATSVCVDRAAGAALVHFEQAAAAGAAVRELRRVAAQASAAEPDRPRLAVDYASRECQVTEAFYEQLEKHGGSATLTGTERLSGDLTPRYIPSTRHEPIRYEGCGSRSRASSYGRGSSRTPRYSTLEHYDPADYAADRRYRVYDELGSSPLAEDTPYEDRLQSVVVSPHRARRHRRDSSPEDRKHSKERHRGVIGASARRSRSGSRGGEKHMGRRRHRRRHEGSGSRAGTPLRDEPDAPPAEPRRPPRDRPPLPMSLPLPKFAAQLLRTTPATPRPLPAPAPAPDSPPRPPSASSSSAGSAPHSPSLEERIRSLDEKYEKWSGSRALPEAPDRTRLRHRLLEVDINEVKPSEVVRSLLAKRSVFDEDSERLEGATRAPSPCGSPHARPPPCVPRALRYPFPAHPPAPTLHTAALLPPHESDADAPDRPADPRLNRPERPYQLERLGKFSESDYRLESRIRLRTPSTDKSQPDSSDRRRSPRGDRERPELDRDPRRDIERRRRDSFYSGRESDSKSSSIDTDEKDLKESIDKVNSEHPPTESDHLRTLDSLSKEESVECLDEKLSTPSTDGKDDERTENLNASRTESSLDEKSVREAEDIISNNVDENFVCETVDKHIEELKEPILISETSNKSEDDKPQFKLELVKNEDIPLPKTDSKCDQTSFQSKQDIDKCKEILIQNQINKELIEFEMQVNHLNVVNSIKPNKEIDENKEFIKSHDKNGKERYNQNIILEAFHNIKCEKENIEFDKTSEKDKSSNHSYLSVDKKHLESEKNMDDRSKEKVKHCKDRPEKDRHDHDRDKSKSSKHERASDKNDKEKKSKDETISTKSHPSKTEKVKLEKDVERTHKDRNDRETDKLKNVEEKPSNHRHDHHRKDKIEKDKRKDGETDSPKSKKDEKCKHDKARKESSDSKRDSKKDVDSIKSRKSSRDESSKDLCRKDSTDSSTSRASHDSLKIKEELVEIKEESKPKAKYYVDIFTKPEVEKDQSLKSVDSFKIEGALKIKTEIKEEKDLLDHFKSKIENTLEQTFKCKGDIIEKPRHYSVDSPGLDCKRKERLNSCSSLPSHIGHKRRMSSQDSIDSINEDNKKCKNESKCPERRDSKESRSGERHKTTKFNKGHFAKIIESKTKDDKKNQVKPPDDAFLELSDADNKDPKKSSRKSPKGDSDEKGNTSADSPPEGLRNDLDFLATLELRSSEEDERQKALRKEMKEKKRIQQLQQIQELLQHEQHPDLLGKFKEEKKQKIDEKKKEAAREKRMSTDRKSRDEKIDKNENSKRKNRKSLNSTDSSDSDEPKKHSIFDIVDDEPTYISMYDKVKARSCKNMQKQEEEKRQEKIKAKFSQLKQSRAKREEKKRSSWDEDSDSEHDIRKSERISMESSSEDENVAIHCKKREQSLGILDYDRSKTNDYFNIIPSTEEDSRNKLSRKNSRTRIISDTSDDDASKRSISKSPCFHNEMRKEFLADFDLLHKIKDDNVNMKESSDKIKKNSLLTLFGKSDSDDSKRKSSLECNDNKTGYMKSFPTDFSSESESIMSNRNMGEVRKKHKRKQKKHKSSFSDEETKVESSDPLNLEGESRYKNSDKLRRHSNKKDKRKDKIRESIDADDSRDEKFKPRKDKKPTNNCFDSTIEANSNNIRKEGKMEDIFGPLSDESDRDVVNHNNKLDFTPLEYDPTFSITNDQLSVTTNSEDVKCRDKEENRRRKEKRRRDKRPCTKDDDNSLDVDAVSKAIEARLIADTMTDDENLSKRELLSESITNNHQNDINCSDIDMLNEAEKICERQIEKMKRDFRDKKKKKKKNKDDRPSRKDHHHYNHVEKFDKIDNFISEKSVELSPKSMLLDIPLPNDPLKVNNIEKTDDRMSPSESSSLPILTDTPPSASALSPGKNTDTKNKDSDIPGRHSGDLNLDIDFGDKNEIEVNDIPMPPPFENIVQDISEVPLPKDPLPTNCDVNKEENSLPSFNRDVDVSEDAVRSISNIEKDTDKETDKVDAHASKVEKKSDEKPRAIISQEETEDAVAALLGESFGGKVNTFPNCYEEVENSPTHQIEVESTTIENENIPEEDAEEMRQAVQNLNASEMEMKPDTPVSDNDLLLIDTDTEEADETPQDAVERLTVNIIANTQSLTNGPDRPKPSEVSNVVVSKPKPLPQAAETTESKLKLNENDTKLQLIKRETIQHVTSTATPVITSWTLSNNKLLEPRLLNIQSNKLPIRDTNDNKPTHITANIVQLKAPQTHQGLNTSLRPIIAPTRVSAPYQVINHMIHPQANMQPPTIKIPEPHILYQKQSGIVISPRMANDHRLQSPKASPQGEGMTSPRLANMTILSTSPQNLNSVGLASPNAIQQRSPGQVTVVRMQQPPLSPIQAMHLPHGARAMVSPNRPNSVLVQTQGAPIHFNRLPVTPVLAPISKQMSTISNVVQQNKAIGINTSPLMHQQKIVAGDCRKNDLRNTTENVNEKSKIILSPTTLQHSTNPTVMAQNRLISMQNAIHAGNINPLHLSNKVLLNNVNHVTDKRENLIQKSEQHCRIPFGSAPIIHVAGMNHSNSSIIQSGTKPVMCTIQEANNINRAQGSNVIHTLNSPRLLTTAPISNVIQIDAHKGPPSVLSMATIRSPTVLTKLESSNSVAVTTSSFTNVVMTPLILKTSSSPGTIRLSAKNDDDHQENHVSVKPQNHLPHLEDKQNLRNDHPKREMSTIVYDALDTKKDILLKPMKSAISPVEFSATKCETDFEELLKDNTNEIKVTNDPEKNLEVNVGKNVTLITTNTQCHETKNIIDSFQKEVQDEKVVSEKSVGEMSVSDSKEDKVVSDNVKTEIKDFKDASSENSNITKIEPEVVSEDKNDTHDKDPLSIDNQISNNIKTPPVLENITNNENKISDMSTSTRDAIDNQLNNVDENDSWSAKDVNIESVIKKVDSLCNEASDTEKKDDRIEIITDEKNTLEPVFCTDNAINDLDSSKPMDIQIEKDNFVENSSTEESSAEKLTPPSKRGGRSLRGKRSEKHQDRVQTRQISKPPRGGASMKRGRGRARVDKKIKSLVLNANNMPGDIYDFHEDSGDESATSPNKNETRPRLIMTIKSPLSGQTNAIATSTLSITPKDHVKNLETKQVNKEDKVEDFVSPSPNTRKSRRLQEKDVQRTTVDDVIEDVIKGNTTQTKVTKEVNKKRQTRQAGGKVNQAEKASGSDTRKSPRGVKRPRDRSLSDASLDSSDEKVVKRDDAPNESKVPKLSEPPAAPKLEPDPPQSAKIITPIINNLPLNSVPSNNPPTAPAPTPIMKPPKKMISEISAKLASAFEAAASASPPLRVQHLVTERLPMETERQVPLIREPRNLEPATAAPAASEPMVVATGEARAVSAGCGAEALGAHAHGGGGEAALVRRLEGAASAAGAGVGGGVAPESATEPGDARVQSPALPHRPSSAHRLADRATPLLLRGGDGEGASVASLANVAGAAGAARLPRGYAGTASLPRGAHYPPHPPAPLAPLAHLHPHAKQVAVVGPHHHTGAASRVTITSVPPISPQGQVALGDGMYPHFSHQHYDMFRQHFRATQHESRATPSPYTTRTLEAEGCEAPAPPLELRRPPSARVPRPAHSPSPADRLIMWGGRSPPPAHGTSRLPGALPPLAPGPPHASQVPREADSLQMLLRRYPVMWQGLLALKNDSAAVQMHFVGGNPGVAGDTLPRHTDGSTPPLRIAQRMRLEPAQLDQVHRKMKLENEHCILLALPCGRDHMDVLQQSTNLTGGFITYLQRKQAAGIVNVAPPGHHQAMYTVHIFPSCDFANENLNRIAPDLMHRVADIAHLLIVIATV